MSKKDAAVVDGKDPVKVKQKRRLRDIEIEKAETELAASKLDLEMDRHRLLSYRDERTKRDNDDKRLGIFSLESSVGSSVVTLANEIRAWGRLKENEGKTITLNLFSPGGSVLHGLVLYDTLRTMSRQGHKVVTVARGYAASMGSLIFLAGDVRLIGAEALVMFHSLSAGTGGSLHDMEDDLEFFKRLNKRLDGIVVSRTKVTKTMLAENTRKRDWWLDSKEAVKYGVAHEIG